MKKKTAPTFIEEKSMWNQGAKHIIGIDEVGVGCFAGPVVVAGVVFDTTCNEYFEDKKHELYKFFHTINDSKKLLAKIREELSPLIQKTCNYFAISEVPVATIDTLGIRKAMFFGMREVIEKITSHCHAERVSASQKVGGEIPKQVRDDNGEIAILVDGFAIPEISHPQKHIIKGDQKCISIAAASIIAKVYRDELMENLAAKYPYYLFDQNKGYGTKSHREAIRQHGLCDLHRKSFSLEKFLQN